MQYTNVQEEEIKNTIAADFFGKFDCTKILGKIDFAVKLKRDKNLLSFKNLTGLDDEYFLWAEAKQKSTDIIAMLAQLVLTIGKARTFDEIMPPKFLGCFDSEKIAFIPYHDIQDIFYQNDFNWNVAPSNHETREFKQIYEKIKNVIENDVPFETYLFNFEKDEKELKRFIRENFIVDKLETTKIRIDKNNFIIIYNKWLETVKPTIAVKWDKTKARGIIDCDFYLADLLSDENKTLKEKLFVLLHGNYYEFDRIVDEDDIYNSKRVEFSDNQKAHTQFWAKYERPPIEDYWNYIVDHRHLLVPQDIRERRGSFYTPRIWVEKSQEYLAKVFGEDWQDEYYVWDCAAGTGNLLVGLTNKYNIWASTLDKADVDIMKDRIDNGANLLHAHVFQFDFLNDDFSKLPDGLREIIDSPSERKKLIIYINPPYAEATTTKTITGTGENKPGVANLHRTKEKYNIQLGRATNEIFAHFLMRIYHEIPFSKIANFSTLKNLQSSNFLNFRENFKAKLDKIFVVPANTFDNVKGEFPIGFFIWDTEKREKFKQITADVYDKNGKLIGTKGLYANLSQSINKWIKQFDTPKAHIIGYMENPTPDFQNNKFLCIINNEGYRHNNYYAFNQNNLLEGCVYFSVRHCIEATWLNDRDQFLCPNKKWKKDIEFHNDCLAYTLFHGQNRISSNISANHWIPFPETEINAKEKYENHFMIDFLSEPKFSQDFQNTQDLFLCKNQAKIKVQTKEQTKREFSAEAQAVFDAGRELWKYYHASQNLLSFKNLTGLEYNVNASLYDIREYFQGRNDKGKMNSKSEDEKYNALIGALRDALKILAKKIEPKVYEYEFLMR